MERNRPSDAQGHGGADTRASGVDVGPPEVMPAQPTILVAHYADPQAPPNVFPVSGGDTESVLEEATATIRALVVSDGGQLPPIVIQELIANLAHAGPADAVISLFDGGNTLRVSDHGPGIPDKERALLPGFTTASSSLRRTIRGVGSGLGLVEETLAALEGSLDLQDNLGGGTVVTARVPRRRSVAAEPEAEAEGPVLTERQLRTLLLIVELGPVGPTSLARELGVSPSTAYRDLVSLEEAALVTSGEGGARTITDQGLTYIQTVL